MCIFVDVSAFCAMINFYAENAVLYFFGRLDYFCSAVVTANHASTQALAYLAFNNINDCCLTNTTINMLYHDSINNISEFSITKLIAVITQ
jgi:hypothetical protein